MTDRELLELAAKAAGITNLQWESDGSMQNRMNRLTIPYECQGMMTGIDWNPLRDDGDALRLAVKLDFEVTQGDDEGPCAWVNYFMKGSVRWLSLSEQHTKKRNKATEAEKQAATRRAIVRAAAEIGKAMP